jgi:hypothetical protein
MSLSLCVPLPTPGAPTNIIRAAFLSFLTPLQTPILLDRVLSELEYSSYGLHRSGEGAGKNWPSESTKAPGCSSSPHGAHEGPENRGGCPQNNGGRGLTAAQKRDVSDRRTKTTRLNELAAESMN